jgi:transcriptional regulator with XRE-family HTH domain
MSEKSIFSQRLRALRKQKKIRQKDLADIMKVSASTVTRWEKGQNEPDTEKIREIADYFQVSADYLIGNSNDPTPTEEIRRDVQSSTPDLKKLLKETKPHWGGKPLTEKQADILIKFFESVLEELQEKRDQ